MHIHMSTSKMRTTMRTLQTLRHLSWVMALAVPGAWGCSSSTISGSAEGATEGGGNSAPGSNGSSAAGGDLGTDPALSEPLSPESAGPLVLRRLSPREYSNTLRDLVGDTSDPGAKLPDEGNNQTGFTVYESASLPSVEAFLKTAEQLLSDKRIPVPDCAGGTAENTCAKQFINDFGRRAFRRPVMGSEETALLGLFATARGLGFSYTEAVSQVASAMLQSSGFLYLWEVGDAAPQARDGLIPLTPYQIASRLSYLLWGTMPDAALSAAADAGELSTPEQIAKQAARLFEDETRLSATAADFHLQWLQIDNLDDLQKDPTTYPVFDDEVRQGFKAELAGFVSDVLVHGDGTVRSLLTASHTVYTADGLATIYGVDPKPDADDHLALDPTERSGLFTLAGILASTGNTNGSNPPRRGKLIWTELLCGFVPPPPANVPPVGAPTETQTTRQRFEAHTGNPCAASCHSILDPPGFAFENYDGVGAYRSEENGFPVDSSGTLHTPAGATIEFKDAVDLMGQLSTSYEVDRCVAGKWFTYMLGRKPDDADQASFEAAYRSAGAGPKTDLSVRDFVAQAVGTTAFRQRSPTE
jgi:Protein of unknown function (DUF1592)/Protein of unknown function (DUF1588)/Protein of unknown function (DUF1595)/Protein of unknown function (DUF1587)/Protein of unknown function (DUF1585)